MHRCLQIPDILYMIVSFLPTYEATEWYDFDRPPDPLTGKEEALSLALVSKHFQEPALDALWRLMPTLKPLMDILVPPEVATRYDGTLEYSDVMEFASWLDRADWSRYDYYARRIQYLRTEQGEASLILLRALNACSRRSSLLPNLRFLYWDYSLSADSFYLLPLFAGPHVTTLVLDLDVLPAAQESALVSLFSTVRFSCPALDKLVVLSSYYEKMGESSGREIALVLSTFPSLRYVTLWNEAPEDAWACLAQMPNLRCLDISTIFREDVHTGELDDDDDGSSRPLSAVKHDPASFPALEHWAVVVDHVPDFGMLISSFQSARELKLLDIVILECPNCADVDFIVSMIRTYCALPTLTSVSFTFGSDDTYYALDLDPPVRASQLLAPFLKYPAMECFRLPCYAIEWDNAFIEHLAAAWPHLRVLAIGSDRYADDVYSTMTLGGLIPLAKHCRYLEHITIALEDFEWKSPLPEWKCDRAPSCVLRVDVTYQEGTESTPVEKTLDPEDLQRIRVFLEDIFPKGTVVTFFPTAY